MKRTYDFNKESGVATCRIYDKDNIFIGFAVCHDDDVDFMSEKTGLQIAEVRAEIDALKHIRDYEIIPALKALKHLQDNMKTSKQYNPKSYEARMLRRQVCIKENELTAIRKEINRSQQFLTNYIEEKDKLYTKLRQAKNN